MNGSGKCEVIIMRFFGGVSGGIAKGSGRYEPFYFLL